MGLKSFVNHMTNIHVHIFFIGNVVTMVFINKTGSSKSSSWNWDKDIWLSMARIAGCDNIKAVNESRHISVDFSVTAVALKLMLSGSDCRQ